MTDDNTIGDGPIEARYKQVMQALGTGIDKILNGKANSPDPKNGFVLLVFPFDDHGGRCNYISNARRKDIVLMLKEQIKRFEGQPDVNSA
jgi:hypothetical protein